MRQRIEKLREKLEFDSYDAAVIENVQQRRYLTGFNSSAGTLVITRERAVLCVDSRYIEAAQNTVKDCEVLLVNGIKGFFEKLSAALKIKKAAVSGETSLTRYKKLCEMFNGVDLFPDDSLDSAVQSARSVKDEPEIECIKRAQEITDSAFSYILGEIVPGKTERELALRMEYNMRENASDGLAFDIIFISGERTSMPHGVPSGRQIKKGDMITMDFGAKYDGYCADMTRTVAVGSVTDEQKKVYNTVLEAQKRCLEGIKAGLKGYEADRLARSVIDSAGYGEYFGHSTGHSLGLCVHEPPSASPLCDEVLLENQMMTVEPGIYLPGRFGVRIEDLVILKEGGCIDLTKSEKELIVL